MKYKIEKRVQKKFKEIHHDRGEYHQMILNHQAEVEKKLYELFIKEKPFGLPKSLWLNTFVKRYKLETRTFSAEGRVIITTNIIKKGGDLIGSTDKQADA